MKHLKKIMAVMLSIVIAITLIPQINFSVKAQESGGFAVTSPTDNALVASGHYDIKWNEETGKEVRNDNVELDGDQV